MITPTSEYFGIIEHSVGFELQVHEGVVHVTVWIHCIGWEVTPFLEVLYGQGFPGSCLFLFPCGFLAPSDFGDKRFPPFVYMVYFAAQQPLGLFFWSKLGVGTWV